MASPTIITGSDTGTLTGASSVSQDTFTVTIPTTDANKMFIVMGGYGGGGALSSATLGGDAMTVINNIANVTYNYIAYIVAPKTGSQSLVLNYAVSGGVRILRGFTLKDVKQISPVDQVSDLNDFNTSTSPTTKNITPTENNELVIAYISCNGDTGTLTNNWSATDAFTPFKVDYWCAVSYLEKTTAGEVVTSYSFTDLGNPQGNLLAISVKYQAPASAGFFALL